MSGLNALWWLSCSYNQLTELNVQGCTSLRGISCGGNQLTTLDVQGLTSLKWLRCYSNKLNAQAMMELLNALPDCEASDKAKAILYTENTGEPEENCKDYTQPEDLKKAFDGAKSRKWRLQKRKVGGDEVDF